MARPKMPQEKVDAVKQDLTNGYFVKQIRERQHISTTSIARIRQKMINDGELKTQPRNKSNGKYREIQWIPDDLWNQFEKLRLPIKKYYEDLRNEQTATKEPREIKQIRLVQREN